jgi:hypothetical protein
LTGADRSHGDANFGPVGNGKDFLVWQREVDISTAAQPVVKTIPEPSCAWLITVGRFALIGIRKDRRGMRIVCGNVRRRTSGWPLAEVLSSIAMIAVLLALFVTAVQTAREAARQAQCKSQLKQIGLAVQWHVDTGVIDYRSEIKIPLITDGLSSIAIANPHRYQDFLPSKLQQSLKS